ncbi:hypothetical protein [Cohnella soli]|uniref:Uncharacterized protein n=1 Tax=Cohnella soli TaxID=425005 RepID=A0ABW0I616_9BACL
MEHKEPNYAFRRRLDEVHKPNRRDPAARVEANETEIKEGWGIVIDFRACPVVVQAAKDLQDYLFQSMNVSVLLRKSEDIASVAETGQRVIVLGTRGEMAEEGSELTEDRSYRVAVRSPSIVICGYDGRGAAQGSYYLEDLLNLREAPFAEQTDTIRAPVFSPRMTHSGWGLDQYPDTHLNAMAHAGFDSILVFVEDVDRTPSGYLDFNNLIDRAERFGIDVYMYSYMVSQSSANIVQPHPDDPGAESFYDQLYGRIIRACPRFKGIVLVGESVEFRSKDSRVAELTKTEWPPDRMRTKPSPGWWPCDDFPKWLEMIRKVVRKISLETEIVFWTYNWGWAPESDRLALIRALPDDITLQVTFEMFQQIRRDGVTHVCVDYTASFEGPGEYFASEAKAARERGLKLYSMSNTGGLTWDFGVIPFEPIPMQWAKRHAALHQARKEWGLSGLMENHHFGWWPSFVSELAKWSYWTPTPPVEQIYEAIARRDFSSEAIPHVLAAWEHWSKAMLDYIPTNEDQYGPFRVGPSYPLIFMQDVKLPDVWHAMWGNEIVLTDYAPLEDPRQSPSAARINVEIESLQRMEKKWKSGNERLALAIELTPDRKKDEAVRLLGMNEFIVRIIRTVIHVKLWYGLKRRLFMEPDGEKGNRILDEMVQLARDELDNARAAIPLVERDSRLGWEASMDYMTDAAHLAWKEEQVQAVLDVEIPRYRASLALSRQGSDDGHGRS